MTGTCLTDIRCLKSLDCSSSKRLEENNLAILLNNSEELEELDASNCVKITRSFLSAAVAAVKNRKNNISLRINLYGTQTRKTAYASSDAPMLKFEFIEKHKKLT